MSNRWKFMIPFYYSYYREFSFGKLVSSLNNFIKVSFNVYGYLLLLLPIFLFNLVISCNLYTIELWLLGFLITSITYETGYLFNDHISPRLGENNFSKRVQIESPVFILSVIIEHMIIVYSLIFLFGGQLTIPLIVTTTTLFVIFTLYNVLQSIKVCHQDSVMIMNRSVYSSFFLRYLKHFLIVFPTVIVVPDRTSYLILIISYLLPTGYLFSIRHTLVKLKGYVSSYRITLSEPLHRTYLMSIISLIVMYIGILMIPLSLNMYYVFLLILITSIIGGVYYLLYGKYKVCENPKKDGTIIIR